MKINIIWRILFITLYALLTVELTIFVLTLRNFDFHSIKSVTITLSQTNHTLFVEKPMVPSPSTTPSISKNNGSKVNSTQETVTFPSYNSTIKEEKNGLITINNPDSPLLLVNKQRKLPDKFIPSQLVVPNVRASFDGFAEKRQMKAVAALALEDLFNAAEKDGQILYLVSAYRSYNRQVDLHQHYIQQVGADQANTFSALPGTSEHQTGLSVDVSSKSMNFELKERFINTSEGKWLADNAHKYGFIIRYPKEKTAITGYTYEPWHIRYVGVPHATYLFNNHLALEEAMKKAPNK